jgi:hypothetical protein
MQPNRRGSFNENESAVRSRRGITALVWKDKGDANMLTDVHNPPAEETFCDENGSAHVSCSGRWQETRGLRDQKRQNGKYLLPQVEVDIIYVRVGRNSFQQLRSLLLMWYTDLP